MNRSTFIRWTGLALAMTLARAVRAGANDVRGVDIIVRKKPGGAAKQARSDHRGGFNLGVLEPGDYSLNVPAETLRRIPPGSEIELTGATRTGRLDIRRAAEGGIPFTLKAPGAVQGLLSVKVPAIDRAITQTGVSGK